MTRAALLRLTLFAAALGVGATAAYAQQIPSLIRIVVPFSAGGSNDVIARAMTERNSRSVVVVDEAGRAVGVVTGADLLPLYRPDGLVGTAAELMSTPIITADPALSLAAAADLMITHEIHRLVVVDPSAANGAPIGVVSTSDIVAEMAQAQSVWQRAGE